MILQLENQFKSFEILKLVIFLVTNIFLKLVFTVSKYN